MAFEPRGRLENSPLLEVVFELKFPGNFQVWEGLPSFQRGLSDRFPKLFVPQCQPGAFPDLTPYRLSAEDGSRSIHVALNLFSVQVRKYGVFQEFRSMFEEIWARFGEVHVPPHFTRLGLRYINILPKHEEGPGRLHPWLNLGLVLPEALSKPIREFSSVARFVFPEGLLRLQTGAVEVEPAPVGHPVTGGFALDMDFAREGEIPVSELFTFFDRGHAIIEDSFFTLLTAEGLANMQGQNR